MGDKPILPDEDAITFNVFPGACDVDRPFVVLEEDMLGRLE